MDAFFHLSERNTSVGQELRAGITTFLAMAYIIAVNPSILSAAGVPFTAALTATCFGAALMTILMGLIANRPIALASGMGINAMVAFGLTLDMGLDWRIAMSAVFIEGVVVLLLVLFGLREAIMDAIPAALRQAIGVGIGLFITFIGLKSGGIVVANESTAISMGDLTQAGTIVAIISILVTLFLYARNIKGSILIGIIVAVIVGLPLGVTPLPAWENFGLDFSSFGAPFQTIPGQEVNGPALVQALINPAVLIFAFSLLMSDFFDTMGTAMGVAKQGEFLTKDGEVENVKEILTVDSAAAAVGGLIGASSITSFVESTAGAADGARTGLSNIFIGILFIIAAFLSPFISMVSGSATAGALVLVGYLMMGGVEDIPWNDFRFAFPAFLIIIGIPFTYSIATGIGFGFIAYVLVSLFTGKVKDVSVLMWISALAFLISFII
ncbi:MAG: NCS2 family permease [Coriobacteriia bacterium]|nr:NCS2 family permease [Coriobacteriia bacterium]